MKYTKSFFFFIFFLLTGIFHGCTTVKYYPVNFVESLKHPTKFPEVFSFTVQNVEEIAAKNPLNEGEETKVTDVGENKNSSMHLVQVCENGELHPHYHKRHDEVIYVKKGSGIATLDGTRYMIKPGSILQIPSKTVHKFLNTGDEPFIAISIFSPPFDGRDEKTIRRKKTDRSKKEERRLASAKSEKTEGGNENVTEKEHSEEEAQTAVNQTKKVAEKRLNKPAKKEWDTDSEESSPSSKKLSPSIDKKGKKGPKETVVTEEPTIDIKDLHEKLTKLLELKEEGTISEEEYEEKKDALIKGKDIGTLPEMKGYSKRKILKEEDDEPVPEHIDKDTSEEKNGDDENDDTMIRASGLSDENKPPVYQVKPEERTFSSEDKLKTLEEMRQEGLITEEEYENKKEELVGSVEEEPVSLPSENIVGSERVKELEELYHEGLITEDDYHHKLKELTGAQTQNDSQNILPEKELKNDKLLELDELKEQGLITEEDYELKKAQLMGN